MRDVTLGGRRLQLIEDGAPIAHDTFLAAVVAEAGLADVPFAAGHSREDLVEGFLDRVHQSGQGIRVLAACLAPAELELGTWTPRVATEMAAFIGGLTAPDDKLLFRALLRAAVTGFFASGVVSLRLRSPASSPIASPRPSHRSTSP